MTEPVREPPTFLTRIPVKPPGPELARRNVLFGLALFGVFVLLFAGTVIVAFVYLAVAG